MRNALEVTLSTTLEKDTLETKIEKAFSAF